ncbi:MAG: hypothetical protein ACI4WT_03730, partial [Oligosphaeraceae bacterium]
MNTCTRLLLTLATAAILPVMASDDDLSAFEKFRRSREFSVEAESQMAEGDYKDAAKNYLKTAELSQEPAKTAFLVKAADAYILADKASAALRLYQELLQNHALQLPYEHAVRQLRVLAENFVVGKGTFLGLCDVPTAIKVYELIIREAPAPHLSAPDRFRLAELLQDEHRDAEAVAVYQAIIKHASRNWDARAKLALLLGKLARSSDGDGTKTRAALREANLVLAYKPDHPLANDLKQLVADSTELNAQRLLEQAQFYLIPTQRRPGAARRYLHDVITNFPNSQAAATARQLLATHPDLVAIEQNASAKTAEATQSAETPKPEETKPAEEAKPEESTSSWTDWLWPFGSSETEEAKPAEAPKAEEAKPEEAKPEESTSSWTDWLWPFGASETEETKPEDETKPAEVKPEETKPAEEAKPEASSSSWTDWLWPFGTSD